MNIRTTDELLEEYERPEEENVNNDFIVDVISHDHIHWNWHS